MKIKQTLLIAIFLLFIGCIGTDKKKPNVIFILVDDLGWNDLGYTGSVFYESPNIDKLSKDIYLVGNYMFLFSRREMAKQVAHEIKNPLTPMRLSVQSFQKNFDINDSTINKKLDEFIKTLIQQIDTMSTIASAFSNFAEMPAQEGGKINIIEITRLALKIFKEKHITFNSEHKDLQVSIDRTQMIRIITNLIKNAIEACDLVEDPLIEVTIVLRNKNVLIYIKDNGVGISDDLRDKIFEPKFTTKTSGMGLGLGMVKNLVNSYSGKISFKSNTSQGTTFKILFPIYSK